MSTRRLSPAAVATARAALAPLSLGEVADRYRLLAARVQAAITALPDPAVDPADPAPYRDRRSASGRHVEAVRTILRAEGAEGLALASLAAEQALGLVPRPNQLATAIALLDGRAVDLATGEGKTLAAALAASLLAAAGRGVHIATANSYLARRDAEWMAPLYEALGLAARPLTGPSNSVSRRDAYRAPVTYATAEALAYDLLTDGAVFLPGQRVRRTPFALIVDEADSLLIDLARSPITLTRPQSADGTRLHEMAALVASLPGPDAAEPGFTVDDVYRTAGPTAEGIDLVSEALGFPLYGGPASDIRAFQLALDARAVYLLDRDYLVIDERIVPIDRRTGRASGGRFRGGLALSLAAKEGLPIPHEEVVRAETTVHALVSLYPLRGAMSGSAAAAAEELLGIYGLELARVAPHRPSIRVDERDRLFADAGQVVAAAVELAARYRAEGRPVMIGTLDVGAAEQVAASLSAAGLVHETLTARDHAREAEILAGAGAPGAITVSAAIAGRGVDIILGGHRDDPAFAERRAAVIAAGGLAIIGIGRHDERRLDEQLMGRSGRQGEPGSTIFYLSADDELFRVIGAERLRSLLKRLGHGQRALFGPAIDRSVSLSQAKLGGYSIDARRALFESDAPMAHQRAKIAAERDRIVDGVDPVPTVRDALLRAGAAAVRAATASESIAEWDLLRLTEALLRLGVTEGEIRAETAAGPIRDRDDLDGRVARIAEAALARRIAEVGPDYTIAFRVAILGAVDRVYEEHLSVVDALRAARPLRGTGAGKAPVTYARDIALLYAEYREHLATEIAKTALNVTPSRRRA